MFIDKIFHLRQPVAEARRRLRELDMWTAWVEDAEVRCWMSGEGVGRVEFGTNGDRMSADIEELAGEDPNQILFRSVRGDLELAGILELVAIRPDLTEVTLTLDYEPARGVRRVVVAVDAFLDRQLARIERSFRA